MHALKKIEIKKKYKYIALLQPTSPLRPKNMISNGIKILKRNKKFQNLIHLERTYYKIGFLSKKNEWQPLYNYTVRGQDITNQFRPSGCLFLYIRKDFENYKKFIKRKNYGFIQKEKIETAVKDLEEAISSDDKAKIEEKSKALAESAQKFGEKVYASQQNQAGQNQQADSADANSEKTVDGDVVDAEFEEVNEEKKEEDK